MIDELAEFQAYTGTPDYTATGKRDVAWLGRFTMDMLLKKEGFARVLVIVARGYLFDGNGEPQIDRARRALCAWCSLPDSKKASPRKDWQFRTDFSDYHAEFQELVDSDGLGWLCRHVRRLCAFARENQAVISKSNLSACEKLATGFETDWRKKVVQFQTPIFSEKTHGAWVLRFDDVLGDAMELGPLRSPEIVFSDAAEQRIAEATPNGIPVIALHALVAYYIANRQEDTDWVVLPVANFDAWLGGSFSRKWLPKLPEDIVIREREKGRGICRYKIRLSALSIEKAPIKGYNNSEYYELEMEL